MEEEIEYNYKIRNRVSRVTEDSHAAKSRMLTRGVKMHGVGRHQACQ